MFKKSTISAAAIAALHGAIGVGGVALPLAATAQVDTRVEITGSLIRRTDAETALPVTTLRADELTRVGATSAEDIVKYFPQAQASTVTSTSVSGTNGAAAYLDLRNLGANRSLVLLNNRRVVPNPFAVAGVDLNTLPMGALERIEALSDGASSTYGTDAIAGVVNFLTKRSYKGFTVEAKTQQTEAGGGDIHTASLLGGIGQLASDGWNVYGALNVRKMEPMRGTERDFMRTSYIPSRGFNGTSPTTFPANYSQTGTISNTNPSLPTGCNPPLSIPIPEANGTTIRCFADTQVFTNVVPEQDQWGAFFRGSFAINPNHTASLEYFHSMNKVVSTIAPSPEGGLTMTPASPFYPGNGITPVTNPALNPANNLSINWRTTVLGSRSGEQENNTKRAVASVQGVVGSWDYDAALLWSNAQVENQFLGGYPMTQPLRNGVSGCSVALVPAGAPNASCPPGQQLTFNGQPVYLNPFGPQTPQGQAYMQANQVLGLVQTGEATLQSASASASTTMGRLAGGSIGVAFNTEFRKEEMRYFTDVPKVSQAASSGLAGSGAVREGERDVSAIAAEVNLPVTKMLDIGLSLRHDKYSDFGNTTNPKISFKLKANEMLAVRGSYNEGFSAPTMYSLYLPNSTTFTANRYNDPVLCPGGNASASPNPARDCGTQFQRLIGGNRNLGPETSSAYTVGFVFEPTRGLSFSVDWWDYHIKNAVSTVGEQSIFADPAKYASLYVRCSQAPADRRQAIGACQNPGTVDPLAYVLDTFQNLGDVKTAGVDVSVDWRGVTTPYGRFGAGARGTYVHRYHFQVEPGGVWYEPVGNYSPQFAGPVIRYQQITTFRWETAQTSTRLVNRYSSGYRDQNAQGAPFNVAPFNTNRVGDYSLWDLSVAYTGIKRLTLGFGVLNVLDDDPPFTNQVGRFQARGYDDRFHNPLGRTYQVSAKYEF